ncbi:MAG: EAL domain-containing protein [Lachnospiraceae bacterium]|nr:EAL domain-containing protein [Lachnospiraceae bacterium]
MNFIVHYDIAALILTATILVHYYLKDRIYTKTSGMFRLLIWIHLVACLFDLGTAVMINNAGFLPNWLQYLLNVIYCIAVYGRTPIYLGYLVCVTKGINTKWDKRDHITVWGLLLIEMIIIVTTPVTGFVFSFDSAGQYHHGPMFDVLYGITIFYYLVAAVRTVKYRATLKKTQVTTVHIYTAMNIVAILVEMISNHFLVAQFVASLAILLIYFSLENPEDYSDKKLAVFNRDGLVLRLTGMVDKKKGFRIMGVPVQGLKYLNDTIGVDNNVLLLKEIAEFFCHIGGVKNVFHVSNFGFAIIYKNDVFAEDCLIDAIRQRFEKPFYLNNMEISLEAPMAVVHYPEDAETIENLIDLLDYAMNEAAHGEDHVIVRANEDLLNKKRREGQVLRAMKTALREQTFQVFYQPIYSVEEKRYTAAEALIRMPNTEIGFIGPDEFIPIAEKNGMILEIGEFVFRTVCEFMVKEQIWEKGIENIHVNLSVVQCMQEKLAQNFLDIMEGYELPCSRINLEVTETAAVVSSECLSANMNKLVANGVRFALDDYGTGFSNATSLIEYPYNTIKIDKGVVWAAMENENAMKVLTHSVAMIKSLDMNIVAEGVETLEQANELTNMGCDYFQGYYYSKPVNAEDFVSLLDKNCA